MLADYNNNPIDVTKKKVTFEKVFEDWKKEKYPTISKSGKLAYNAAFKECKPIYSKPFSDLRLDDFQKIIDTCGKNYPTLKKIKILFSQLSAYACMHDISGKDYSSYINIAKYKDKNLNKIARTKFKDKEINSLWNYSNDEYIQIILMLIYSGVRISEMLNLKKEKMSTLLTIISK